MSGEELVPVGEGDDGHFYILGGRVGSSESRDPYRDHLFTCYLLVSIHPATITRDYSTSEVQMLEYRRYIRARRFADGGAGDEFVEQGDDGVGVRGTAEAGERVNGLDQVWA